VFCVSEPIHDESPASGAETRAYLLTRAKRYATPILKDFVQSPPRRGADRPGPLSTFVRRRDLRGLHALLFVLAVTSSGDSDDGWSTTLAIQVWARALGLTEHATDASAATAVSKIFARLEQRRLIERERHGRARKVRVTLLREDGSGDPYTRSGKGNPDRFLQLPHAYWLDDWFARLDLPATAMLLVALHEKPSFELPTEHMPAWYGWSADTAERGFATLEELDLLTKTARLKKAPLSPTGLTKVNVYRLIGPFARTPLPLKLEPAVAPVARPHPSRAHRTQRTAASR
jgi:hypothetical protein